MSISIRPADIEREGDQLVALQRAGYAQEARLVGVDSLPAQRESIEDLRGATIWVAEADDVPVGLLGIEDGDEPLIARLVVHPDHSRKGIGRALVHHALALAGGRPVRVGTAAANAPALALYASLGFEQVRERTVGDGLPFVDLRLTP